MSDSMILIVVYLVAALRNRSVFLVQADSEQEPDTTGNAYGGRH